MYEYSKCEFVQLIINSSFIYTLRIQQKLLCFCYPLYSLIDFLVMSLLVKLVNKKSIDDYFYYR